MLMSSLVKDGDSACLGGHGSNNTEIKMNEPIASPPPVTRDDITDLLNFFRSTAAQVQGVLNSEPVREAILDLDALTKAAMKWIGKHREDIRLALYNLQGAADLQKAGGTLLLSR
jgi:hypothetical protein